MNETLRLTESDVILCPSHKLNMSCLHFAMRVKHPEKQLCLACAFSYSLHLFFIHLTLQNTCQITEQSHSANTLIDSSNVADMGSVNSAFTEIGQISTG